MDKELPCRLGNVEVVVKECIDRGKSFLIDRRRIVIAEDLMQEHPAEIDGKLEDQPSDAKFVIGKDPSTGIKDLSDIHRHAGFLVGLGEILQIFHDRSVGGSGVHHSLRSKHVYRGNCALLQFSIVIFRVERLDQYHTALIDLCQIITALCRKKSCQHLKSCRLGFQSGCRAPGRIVSSRIDIKDDHRPGLAAVDMKLACPVMDIHHQQVVQEQVLKKIAPVQTFLIGDDQVLQLADRHLGHHKSIISGSGRSQDIEGLCVVQHLEQEAVPYNLAVHRHMCKSGHDRCICRNRFRRSCDNFSVQILYTKLCS